MISRLERGEADGVALRAIDRVTEALGARVDVRLLWQGEGLDRLLDARHAAIVEDLVRLLAGHGWAVATEVSFNIGGERGSIDVMAYHTERRTVLIVEVKSVVPDLQSMLAALDRKGRLARTIAGQRGWDANIAARLLVLPNDRTARRRVTSHGATFATSLPARNVEVRRWIKEPTGTLRGILFVTSSHQPQARHRISRADSTRRAS